MRRFNFLCLAALILMIAVPAMAGDKEYKK